jgi:hypothetical protein
MPDWQCACGAIVAKRFWAEEGNARHKKKYIDLKNT